MRQLQIIALGRREQKSEWRKQGLIISDDLDDQDLDDLDDLDDHDLDDLDDLDDHYDPFSLSPIHVHIHVHVYISLSGRHAGPYCLTLDPATPRANKEYMELYMARQHRETKHK